MQQENLDISVALEQSRSSAVGPQNYASNIVKMLDAELGIQHENWVRYSLIICGSLLLMLTVPWYLPLATLSVHLGCCAVFLIYCRSRGPFVSRTEFIIGHALFSLNYAIFCSCCLIYWIQPSVHAQTAAVLGVIGGLIYVLEKAPVLCSATLVNGVILLVTAVAMSMTISVEMGSWVPPLIVCLAFIYIFHSLHTRFLSGLQLDAAIEKDIELKKMEAVGRLSGGIAHEFNNILTALMGNLELYDESKSQDERDQLVQGSRASARRAANLTAQLLSYSRKAPLRPELVDVPQLLESFTLLMGRLLPPRYTVKIHSEEKPPAIVSVDRAGLNNALLNLVYNARDAMPEGGEITLRLETDTVSPDQSRGHPMGLVPGGYVEIGVEDSGAGIHRDLRSQVVEPFFSTKNPNENPGLGLPMVMGFAQQSGGALRFGTSDIGGAAVTLVLPISQQTIPPGFSSS